MKKFNFKLIRKKIYKEVYDRHASKSKIAKTIDAICKEKPNELTHSISKLHQDLSNIFDLRYLSDCPPQNVKDGGVFKAGFSKDLDELIAFKQNLFCVNNNHIITAIHMRGEAGLVFAA